MCHNYFPVIADRYLCVCALVEMIIKKRLNKSVTQHEIAEFIGINVPVNYEGSIKNVNYVNDENLYGMVLNYEGLNPLFKKLDLEIREEYHTIFKFQDWEFYDFIKENLNNNREIILGFSYGALFSDNSNLLAGHACLVENVENGNVSIYDPGPEGYGFKIVESSNLYSAIKVKKDGLWIIN